MKAQTPVANPNQTAPLAQSDRASVFETVGYWFDPNKVLHFTLLGSKAYYYKVPAIFVKHPPDMGPAPAFGGVGT